jgi:hypothetical protein
MRQAVRSLGELDRLYSGLIEQDGPLEYIHGWSIESGAQIDIPAAVLRLPLDNRCRSLTSEPRRVEQIILLENAHGPGPLECGQSSLDRTAQGVIERQESGSLSSTKDEVRQSLGSIGKGADRECLWRGHDDEYTGRSGRVGEAGG